MALNYSTSSPLNNSISLPSSLEPSSITESVTRPPMPHPLITLTPPPDDYLPSTSIASTLSDDLHPGIMSADIPIYAHCLHELPTQLDLDLMLDHLKDSHLTSTLDVHMNVGSPLYSLYKVFLQVARLDALYTLHTSITQIDLWATVVQNIKDNLEGEILLTLQQLSMPKFLADIECYLWQVIPNVVHEPSTPSALSSPLGSEEQRLVETMEQNWCGHDGSLPLTPSHPHYRDACFTCRRLGHIRVNCRYYQCPGCLEWALNHTQSRCPCLHRTVWRTSTNSSNTSYSPPSPTPLPISPRPPCAQQASGPLHHQTAHIHCPAPHCCTAPILHNNEDDLDLAWDETAYVNTSGSPGPEYGGFN